MSVVVFWLVSVYKSVDIYGSVLCVAVGERKRVGTWIAQGGGGGEEPNGKTPTSETRSNNFTNGKHQWVDLNLRDGKYQPLERETFFLLRKWKDGKTSTSETGRRLEPHTREASTAPMKDINELSSKINLIPFLCTVVICFRLWLVCCAIFFHILPCTCSIATFMGTLSSGSRSKYRRLPL